MNAESELFQAIREGSGELVDRLLEKEPGLCEVRSQDGISPLMWACYHRQESIAKRLEAMSAKRDVFEAAARGDVETLRGLIDQEASVVQSMSVDGFSPLHLACYFDRPEAVELLLESGADANVQATNGSELRPLHSAASSRSLRSTSSLIRHGADLNQSQKGGFTALHSAAHHGEGELLDVLLDAGADPLRRTDEGKLPIDLAREQGHEEVVQRLASREQG